MALRSGGESSHCPAIAEMFAASARRRAAGSLLVASSGNHMEGVGLRSRGRCHAAVEVAKGSVEWLPLASRTAHAAKFLSGLLLSPEASLCFAQRWFEEPPAWD